MNPEPRYTVIESRRWKNQETGATASPYGACPWVSDSDRENWTMETVGWTVRNNQEGTIGVGRLPWKTREESQAFADKWN